MTMNDSRAESAISRWVTRGLLSLPLLLPVLMNPYGDTVESAKAYALYILLLPLAVLGTVGWLRGPERWCDIGRVPRIALMLGLALALASIAAALTSTEPLRSLTGSAYWRGGLITTICYLVVFVLSYAVFGRQRNQVQLLAAISGGSLPVSAYAIVQTLGIDVIGWDIDFDGRAFSTLGSPIVLGNYLAMVLPITVSTLLKPGRRLLAVVAVALQCLALTATLSRGAWLAAFIGLVVVMAHMPGGRLRRIAVVAMMAVTLIALVLALRADPRTGAIRLALWHEAAALIAERPMFGYGQEAFGVVFPARQSSRLHALVGREVALDHAHNLWVDLAFESGILGVSTFSLLLALVIVWGVAIARRSRDRAGWSMSVGLVGSLFAYGVEGATMFPTVVPSTLFWLLAGATLAQTLPCIRSLALEQPRVLALGSAHRPLVHAS